MLRSSNSITTFNRAPTWFDDPIGVWDCPGRRRPKTMGRRAPSAFPLIPMAPHIPSIASFSRFLEGKLERNHYQYTDRLVTHRSPKMCMYRYQWHREESASILTRTGSPARTHSVPFLHNPRHFKRNRPRVSRPKMRCANAKWDRLSDPLIVIPRRCIQAPGAASRPLGVFRPCGSIVRTVRHYSYRLKVNQSGLARVVFL
jgi:hypothetical protein